MLVWYLKTFITYGITPLVCIVNSIVFHLETLENYKRMINFVEQPVLYHLRKTKEEEEIYLDAISAFYSALNQNDW